MYIFTGECVCYWNGRKRNACQINLDRLRCYSAPRHSSPHLYLILCTAKPYPSMHIYVCVVCKARACLCVCMCVCICLFSNTFNIYRSIDYVLLCIGYYRLSEYVYFFVLIIFMCSKNNWFLTSPTKPMITLHNLFWLMVLVNLTYFSKHYYSLSLIYVTPLSFDDYCW